MNDDFPVPPGLEFMLEKRGCDERRSNERRDQLASTSGSPITKADSVSPTGERRSKARRQKRRRKSDRG